MVYIIRLSAGSKFNCSYYFDARKELIEVQQGGKLIGKLSCCSGINSSTGDWVICKTCDSYYKNIEKNLKND